MDMKKLMEVFEEKKPEYYKKLLSDEEKMLQSKELHEIPSEIQLDSDCK
jgi:hypothetical protein